MSKVYVTATVKILVNTSGAVQLDEIVEQLAERLDSINEIEAGFTTVIDQQIKVTNVK